MRFFITAILLMAAQVQAEEIYRVVGPDGQITGYTDEKPADGQQYEQVDLAPDTEGVQPGPAVSFKPDSPVKTREPTYSDFRIVRPENDSAVRQM